MKEQILKLRSEGKSYNQIVDELGCSKGTVSYHCGDGQKAKSLIRQRRNRYNSVGSVLAQKWAVFCKRGGNTQGIKADEIMDKFGDNPICYLTGEKIDFRKPSSFHFDHIVPKSKGGSDHLYNLELASRNANLMKTDMSVEELLSMCHKVINHMQTGA